MDIREMGEGSCGLDSCVSG